MWLPDEAWWAENETIIRQQGTLAPERASVWNARMVSDAASGKLSRPVSRWTHLNGLRKELGQGPLPAPTWKAEEVGTLRVDGLNILNDRPDSFGTVPWFLMGYRMLDVLPLVHAGRLDLDAALDEPAELGYNTVVLSTMMSDVNHPAALRPQDDPHFYDWLGGQLDIVRARGMRGFVIAIADGDRVMPRLEDQLRHWRALGAVLRGGYHIASVANEGPKNGVPDATPFQALDGAPVWSRGSTGGQGAVLKGSIGEYEVKRSPIWGGLAESLGILYVVGSTDSDNPNPTHQPVVHIENFHVAEVASGNRVSDPAVVAAIAGSCAAGRSLGVAGWTLLTDDGAVGRRLGPNQRKCAEAGIQAMRAGFVR